MGSAFAVAHPSSAALRALNYTPEVETFRRRQDSRESVSLGELLISMGPAYGSVFVRRDCEPKNGVELMTQSDMFAAEPRGRIIRRDSMSRPERHEIRRWQILVAAAGTLGETELYGRCIIADNRLVGKYVGPHAMVLTFDDEGGVDNLYTYAFLCSRIGIKALRSASYGTKILGIRKDILAELPIPLADSKTRCRVADLVRRTVGARERYAREFRFARAVVEALPEMQEALGMCGERRGRCVLWNQELSTLCAWTYASTGGALAYLSRKWKVRLDDVLQRKGLFNGPRFARVGCNPPHGIELLSQRDAFLIRPVPQRILHPDFSDSRLFAPPGVLLVGAQGTLGERELFGRVILAGPYFARKAFTQHLLRLLPMQSFSETAYAYLSSLVGRRLLRSTAVGTKLLSMRPDLLRRLPFPDLCAADSKRIEIHITNAIDARAESVEYETEAVRIVEEEVLPAWLA